MRQGKREEAQRRHRVPSLLGQHSLQEEEEERHPVSRSLTNPDPQRPGLTFHLAGSGNLAHANRRASPFGALGA